jgi:hypothetical protein
MTDPQWSPDELDRIAESDELEIATFRVNGTARPYIPIWAVRVGDDVYVRSYHGPLGRWYRRAIRHHAAWIRVGDIERHVRVEEAPLEAEPVSQAYRAKYARYGETYVGPMINAEAVSTTLALIPDR